QRYPKLFPDNPLTHMTIYLREQFSKIGQLAVTYSLASITGLIQAILYVVLVPLLVFFMLKDAKKIGRWLSQFLPRQRGLVRIVWGEVNEKIGAYVRGRVVEIIIIGVVTSLVFGLLKLQYAILMGVLVG